MEAIDKKQNLGFKYQTPASGLNLARLCAYFVNISMHLFGGVGWGKSYSSFSCFDNSKPDRTLNKTRV